MAAVWTAELLTGLPDVQDVRVVNTDKEKVPIEADTPTATQNALTPSVAQIRGCGETPTTPCWINSPRPLEIVPATRDGMFWVTGPGGAPVDVSVKQ